MDQHPIPQQISSYQFRLVGDMTLNQFFKVAGGCLIALVFYATNIPGFLKWPAIIFFVLMGAALAFLPFQERPLETWLASFFRSVYSPTLFFWTRTTFPQKIFQDEPETKVEEVEEEEYQIAKDVYSAKTETKEKEFLSKIKDLFVQAPPKISESSFAFAAAPGAGRMGGGTSPLVRPKIVVEEGQGVNPVAPLPTEAVSEVLTGEKVDGTRPQFSSDAAPPNPPSIPNTVVGQVMDNQAKIVEGAILEIRDSKGVPVRALRTNKLGHFFMVTALENGSYEIIIEKDGLSFDPVSFTASGSLISPIAIRAKAAGQTETVSKPESSPTNPMANGTY